MTIRPLATILPFICAVFGLTAVGNPPCDVLNAARNGDLVAVETFLAEGGDPNIQESCQSLLAAAVDGGREAIVSAVLKADPDLYSENRRPCNALIQAVQMGRISALTRLLEAGLDPNARTDKGSTALMIAAVKGDAVAVEALLSAGAELKAKDRRGRTALAQAALNGRDEAVSALLAAGANPNRKDKTRATPLLLATIRGFPTTVALLVQAGGDPKRKDREGRNALEWADLLNHQALKDALGNALETSDETILPPIHAAARDGDARALFSLLHRGVSVDDRDAAQRTPLMYAAGYGRVEAALLLLEFGADPNARSLEAPLPTLFSPGPLLRRKRFGGVTPLGLAFFNKDISMRVLLAEADADLLDPYRMRRWRENPGARYKVLGLTKGMDHHKAQLLRPPKAFQPSAPKGRMANVVFSKQVDAVYPSTALLLNDSPPKKTVFLTAAVGSDGSIRDIAVHYTTDDYGQGFERAAVEALRRWRAEPARVAGQPIDVRLIFDFTIKPLPFQR